MPKQAPVEVTAQWDDRSGAVAKDRLLTRAVLAALLSPTLQHRQFI